MSGITTHRTIITAVGKHFLSNTTRTAAVKKVIYGNSFMTADYQYDRSYRGDKSAQKAKKLLNDKRFDKGSKGKSKRSKPQK